jgi:hypothetical protein
VRRRASLRLGYENKRGTGPVGRCPSPGERLFARWCRVSGLPRGVPRVSPVVRCGALVRVVCFGRHDQYRAACREESRLHPDIRTKQPRSRTEIVWRYAPISGAGGCHPAATHWRRASTISRLFKRSATTVARPIGVSPLMRVPPSDHTKCPAQRWARGLNNGMLAPVTGSRAVILELLNSLQR